MMHSSRASLPSVHFTCNICKYSGEGIELSRGDKRSSHNRLLTNMQGVNKSKSCGIKTSLELSATLQVDAFAGQV